MLKILIAVHYDLFLQGSWCYKSHGQDDKEGWCMSKKCDSIQLESPSDDQISFFSKFSIFSLI